MGKAIPDAEYDEFADDLIATGNQMVACSAQPTTYAEAEATFMLAAVALGAGDYTKQAGDVDGRQLLVASKTGTVTNGGTAINIAIIDTINSALKRITTCTPIVLSAGTGIVFPSWKIKLRAPI